MTLQLNVKSLERKKMLFINEVASENMANNFQLKLNHWANVTWNCFRSKENKKRVLLRNEVWAQSASGEVKKIITYKKP